MAAAAATLVLLFEAACVSVPASGTGAPSMTRAPFGSVDGQSVELFTLTNAHGIEVKLTNYGGIITELRTPDRSGHFDDIVLGDEHRALRGRAVRLSEP